MGFTEDFLIKAAAALVTTERHPTPSVAGFLDYKATESGLRTSLKELTEQAPSPPAQEPAAPASHACTCKDATSAGGVGKTVAKIAVGGAIGLLALGVIGAIAGKKGE